MKKLLLFILALTAVVCVKANDSEYFAIGNQLVPMRQSNISVTKEVLKIRLDNENFANVDVDYTFDNHSSQAQTILMGFETPTPYFMDATDAYPSSNDYIKDFTITLNDKNIPFSVALVDPNNMVGKDGKIQPIDWNVWEPSEMGYGGGLIRKGVSMDDPYNEDDYMGCVYAYYFEAKFQPGKNTLRHTYRYKMGVGVDYVYKLDYLLTPATRWANGQIDDFTLEISCKGVMRDFVIVESVFEGCESKIIGTGKKRKSDFYDISAMEYVLRDASLVYHAKDFKPKGELCLISKCSYMTMGMDMYEEKYDMDPENLVYDSSNEIFSNFLEYNPAILQKMPAATRRIIRNLPYAARGHKFQNKQLADFFSKCFWYIPAENGPDYKAVPLTPAEEKITKAYN